MSQFKVIKDFNYGSISDPQRMIAGNIMDCKDFDIGDLRQWKALGWIEVI